MLGFGSLSVIFQFIEFFFIFIGLTLFYDKVNSVGRLMRNLFIRNKFVYFILSGLEHIYFICLKSGIQNTYSIYGLCSGKIL